MSRQKFTPEQERLLALPVVLTATAWAHAVHMQHPKSLSELAQRLAYTLKAGYHGLLQKPYEQPVLFGFYRHKPLGDDRTSRHYLELQIQVVSTKDQASYLLISLPKEPVLGL